MKKILLLIATSTASIAYLAQGCSELYFSEYIEGSGQNKALEIYNPTSASIDLSTYKIELFTNGSSSSMSTLNLSGSINAGDVYVVCNVDPQVDPAILAQKDTTHAVCNFNGDDAIVLSNSTTQIDIIGIVDVDPGSSWSVDTGATKDYTLVRKAATAMGTITWSAVGDTTWIAYSQNDFSFIGSHTADPCGSITSPLSASITLNEDTICLGSSIDYNASVSGGTSPYSSGINFGDGSTSATLTGTHMYTSAGTYTLTFNVSDDAIPSQIKDSTITIVVNSCSSIKEQKKSVIGLYPNPSLDGFVQLTDVKENSSVTVYNIIGETVFSQAKYNNERLNLSHLNSGSYIVIISNENNRQTKKLIIE